MELLFETRFGEIKLRGAMLNVNGTDLCDGVEILLDDDLVGETVSTTISCLEDCSTEEIEEFVMKYADV